MTKPLENSPGSGGAALEGRRAGGRLAFPASEAVRLVLDA